MEWAVWGLVHGFLTTGFQVDRGAWHRESLKSGERQESPDNKGIAGVSGWGIGCEDRIWTCDLHMLP